MVKLVMYDIANDKKRDKIAKILEERGLDRIQYSVFVGKQSPAIWDGTWHRLNELYKKFANEFDRVYVIDISDSSFRKLKSLGTAPDIPWILHDIKVLYI